MNFLTEQVLMNERVMVDQSGSKMERAHCLKCHFLKDEVLMNETVMGLNRILLTYHDLRSLKYVK